MDATAQTGSENGHTRIPAHSKGAPIDVLKDVQAAAQGTRRAGRMSPSLWQPSHCEDDANWPPSPWRHWVTQCGRQ